MKKLILFILLSTLIFAGCSVKKEGNFTRVKIDWQRTVWINQDVECCGVKDPANNLEWFKKITDEMALHDFPYRTFLFRDTKDDYIVVLLKGRNRRSTYIYECNGTRIGYGSYNFGYNFVEGEAFNSFEEQLKQVNKKNKTKKNNKHTTKRLHPFPCSICEDFYKTHTLIDTISYFNGKL